MLPADVIDLRRGSGQTADKLDPGTPIYAVANRIDPGTSGPFFLDPTEAIFNAFHMGLANKSLIPFTSASAITPMSRMLKSAPAVQNVSGVAGKMATNFRFSSDMVLVELKCDKTIVFDRVIIKGKLEEKSFCNDKKWGAALIPGIVYETFEIGINKLYWPMPQTPTPDIKIDLNSHIQTLIMRVAMADIQWEQSKPSSLQADRADHMVSTFVAFRVCRPQDIFRSRSYFPIDWEKVWIQFVTTRHIQETPAAFKQSLATSLLDIVGGIANKHPLPAVKLDGDLATIVMKYLPDIKDYLAMSSLDRFHRRVIRDNPNIQRISQQYYLPKYDDYYTGIVGFNFNHSTILLGVPKRSKGRKWWAIPPVLFTDDIPADNNTELPKTIKASRMVMMKKSKIGGVLAACNSFISMFCMHYSMMLYDNVPAQVKVGVSMVAPAPGLPRDGPQYTAEKVLVSPKNLTPSELLTYRPRISHGDSIEDIGIKGSWLHDLDIAPMFQHPDFIAKLEALKRIELGLWDRKSVNLTRAQSRSIFQGTSQFLTLFKLELPLCYMISSKEIPPASKMKLSYQPTAWQTLDIYIDWSLTTKHTRDALVVGMFDDSYFIQTFGSRISIEKRSVASRSFIPFNPFGAQAEIYHITLKYAYGESISYSNHSNYYVMYMYIVTFIRMMILDEDADDAQWAVNWE